MAAPEMHRDASITGTQRAITLRLPLRRKLKVGLRPQEMVRAVKAKARAKAKAAVEIKLTEKERDQTKEKVKEKAKAAKAVRAKARASLRAVATSVARREWNMNGSLAKAMRIASSLVRTEAIRMTGPAEVNLSGLFVRASPVSERP